MPAGVLVMLITAAAEADGRVRGERSRGEIYNY